MHASLCPVRYLIGETATSYPVYISLGNCGPAQKPYKCSYRSLMWRLVETGCLILPGSGTVDHHAASKELSKGFP